MAGVVAMKWKDCLLDWENFNTFSDSVSSVRTISIPARQLAPLASVKEEKSKANVQVDGAEAEKRTRPPLLA